MLKYLIRRLLQMPVILLLVLSIIFVTLRLSGDPATLFVSQEATPEDIARVREELGFSQPLYVQYLRFLADTAQGQFGLSLRYGQQAFEVLLQRWPATLQLALASLLLSVAIGIPMGVIAALKRGSLLDRVTMLTVLFGQGAPTFWIGVMLILVFGVQLRWLPVSGAGTLRHLILPSVTLGIFFAARVARFTRTAILEVMPQDYLRTARAKGLKESAILRLHIAKNAAIPVVTIVGLSLPALIGGAVITETVFTWPGVGTMMVQAVYNRDYPVVQAGVFVIAIFILLTNLLIDLTYAWLDPRIKYD